MNNITECYKEAEKAVREYFKDVNENDFAVHKLVYYHGEAGFSFSCGYCHMPVKEKDHTCKWCGKEFRR